MTSLQGASGLYGAGSASSLFGQSGQAQGSNPQQSIMSMMQMLMGMIVGLMEGANPQQQQGGEQSSQPGCAMQSQPNFGGFGSPPQATSNPGSAMSFAGIGGGLGNFLA